MSNRDLIVVGVDGSEGAQHALRWALVEGRRTGSAVEAVTVWSRDGIEGSKLAAAGQGQEREHAERVSQQELYEALTDVGSQSPIAREVAEGHPVAVLTRAADRARLLVLGNHGHSRLRQAVLGSVAQECMRQATCPVVVVPTPGGHVREVAIEPVPAGPDRPFPS
jgi:nucleotide-binding universal stress UspA family protein